jgi:hypothetical protein
MCTAKSKEIDAFICEAFEKNYALIRLESGHAFAAQTKKAARDQALLYWWPLREIAEKVTETEVRLRLPNQRTPKGRKFNIEGVVDIVQSGEKTIMYDFKTHDADYVRSNLSFYEEQINVYAYIWQKVRGTRLDGAAILAMRPPNFVKAAQKSGDPAWIDKARREWNPEIPIRIDPSRVKKAIHEFGKVVDSIEERKFKAPRASILRRKESPKGQFALTICGNCDARFSCDSYREWSISKKPKRRRASPTYGSRKNQEEREARLDAALSNGP